jgi:hypothetical protein
MATTMRAIACAAALAYGCAGTIEVKGGPQAVSVRLKRDGLIEQLQPLVAGDPRATERLADVAARERRAKVLLYGELGMVLGCVLLTPSESSSTSATGLGMCIGGILLGIGVLIIAPRQKTYGAPLRVYNEGHPTTPYVAPDLGVP